MVIPTIRPLNSGQNSSLALGTPASLSLGITYQKYRVIFRYYLGKFGAVMSSKMVRMSFTLPPEIRDHLDFLSGRLGVTKSALVSELLGSPLDDLRSLVEMVPENPTEADLLRARGKSNELITQRLQSFRAIEGDLFDDRNL